MSRRRRGGVPRRQNQARDDMIDHEDSWWAKVGPVSTAGPAAADARPASSTAAATKSSRPAPTATAEGCAAATLHNLTTDVTSRNLSLYISQIQISS
jgi:hypothetical protein